MELQAMINKLQINRHLENCGLLVNSKLSGASRSTAQKITCGLIIDKVSEILSWDLDDQDFMMRAKTIESALNKLIDSIKNHRPSIDDVNTYGY